MIEKMKKHFFEKAKKHVNKFIYRTGQTRPKARPRTSRHRMTEGRKTKQHDAADATAQGMSEASGA